MDSRTQRQMKAPQLTFPPVQSSLQRRKCACGGSPGLVGECEECRNKGWITHRTNQTETFSTMFDPKTLRSSIQPTNSITPIPSEPRLKHDFSRISVHAPTRQYLASATKSLEETDQGTATINSESMGTATENGEGASTSGGLCGVTGSWVSIPRGVTLPARLSGNKLGVEFDMIGEYSPTEIPCNCSCGEYRQYVRGEFKKNGATVTHPLCGTNLDPSNFQEDCARRGGTDYKYGYRSIPFATSRFTNPDQATGCTFEGFDYPGIRGTSGDTLEVNLDFYAELVDTCRGATLAGADWSVAGAATVP